MTREQKIDRLTTNVIASVSEAIPNKKIATAFSKPRNDENSKKSRLGFLSQHVNNAGFTLAEVLITLGIIGVVAAMTIPTLIANTQSAKFRSQYKKTLSTLNQAVKMNVAQHGIDFTGLKGSTGNSGDGHMSMHDLLNNNLTGAQIDVMDNGRAYTLKDVKTYTLSYREFSTKNILSDGSMFIYGGDLDFGTSCTLTPGDSLQSKLTTNTYFKNCVGFIDVNGPQLPNTEVSCVDKTKNVLGGPVDGCVVDNKTMGDVFPVVMHDDVVEPASPAAKYVLNTTK